MALSPRIRKLWPIGIVAVIIGAAVFGPRVWNAATAAARQGVPTAPPRVPPSPDPPPPAADIRGTTWRWQRTEGRDGSTIVVREPTRYTIQFQPNGQLAIRADCNQVIGTYVADGPRLTPRLGPSTRVACPPDSQADPFVAGLQEVGGFTVSGEELRLELGTGNGTMVFAPHPPAALVGPLWHLLAYNNGKNAVVSLADQTEVTAIFGTDGIVSGSAGCNTYRGPYRVSGETIAIGPLATTRVACPEPIMEQERAYLAALEAATIYLLTADQLTLRDWTDAMQGLFTLSVAPAPGPTAPR